MCHQNIFSAWLLPICHNHHYHCDAGSVYPGRPIGMASMTTFGCRRSWLLARFNGLRPATRSDGSVSFGLLSRDARVFSTRWQPSTRATSNFSNSDAFAMRFCVRMQSPLNTNHPSTKPSSLKQILQMNVASIRTFQHMSQRLDHGSSFSTTTSPAASTPPPPPPKDAAPKAELDMPTAAQQRRTDWTIVKRLMVNVWPKNDWKTRLTVVFGFLLLVTAKVVYFLLSCCSFSRA